MEARLFCTKSLGPIPPHSLSNRPSSLSPPRHCWATGKVITTAQEQQRPAYVEHSLWIRKQMQLCSVGRATESEGAARLSSEGLLSFPQFGHNPSDPKQRQNIVQVKLPEEILVKSLHGLWPSSPDTPPFSRK